VDYTDVFNIASIRSAAARLAAPPANDDPRLDAPIRAKLLAAAELLADAEALAGARVELTVDQSRSLVAMRERIGKIDMRRAAGERFSDAACRKEMLSRRK
jgi:hypothetical protein